MRTKLAVLVAGVLLVAGCSPSDRGGDRGGDRADARLGSLWKTVPDEPYPFSGDVPPLVETPLDGLYVREVPVAEVGRPVPCRRCPPYKIHAGEARLRLERGRYHIDEDGSQFGSEGHFVVEGNQLTLFNDPICADERVTFRYSLAEGTLTFEPLRDPCAYQNLRGRYLTSYPWKQRR